MALVARRGFALAAALLAAVLIGALLAGMFFAVNEETRSGAALAGRDDALSSAESALEGAVEQLRANPPAPLPIGSLESMSVESADAGVIVHRISLDGGLFWLVAVVTSDADPAAPARRVGLLARAIRAGGDSITIVRHADRGWSELF